MLDKPEEAKDIKVYIVNGTKVMSHLIFANDVLMFLHTKVYTMGKFVKF